MELWVQTHAWLSTPRKGQRMTREEEMRMAGEPARLPPLDLGGAYLMGRLVHMGCVSTSGMGREGIPPERLRSWSIGTATPLDPQDFSDLLIASRAYAAAIGAFHDTDAATPWAPDATPGEMASRSDAEERQWDAIMGVQREG